MKLKIIIKTQFLLLCCLYLNQIMAQVQPPSIKVSNTVIRASETNGKEQYFYNKWKEDLEGVALNGKYIIFIEKVIKNDIPSLNISNYTVNEGWLNQGYKNKAWKTLYKRDAVVKKESWNNGLITGEYKVYTTSKKLLYETNFGKAGNGKYKDYYYATGVLKQEGNYENGKKQGEWCDYDTNGNVKKITKYISGIPEE